MSTVRDAIVAKLNAVPGIGKVNAYQRYADEMRDLEAMYVADGVLLGWFVSRVGVVELTAKNRMTIEKNKWLISGFMAINDANASELVFDDLLDLVRDAFRTEQLEEAPGRIIYRDDIGKQTGIAIDDVVPALFAGVLCHFAKCTLITQQLLRYAPQNF